MASSQHNILLILLFALLIICVSHSSNAKSSPQQFLKGLNGTRKGDVANGLIDLKKYLEHLGYYMDHTNSKPSKSMHGRNNDSLFDESLESAIRKYQRYFKLKTTGYLDQETVKLLMQPRCGTPDYGTASKMSGRYEIVKGWGPGLRNLTFTYETEVSLTVTSVIAAAIVKWERVSPFRFEYTGRSDAHVFIGFYTREHGDGYPFDGKGGILAHAFYPPTGVLHFDGEELWGMNVGGPGPTAVDLHSIALHELGHILGIGHSDYVDSVMFPTFSYGKAKRNFFYDDFDAIKALYPNG